MAHKNGSSAPTSAALWRKPHEEGVLFHFPSGMIARVRPVNMGTFLSHGSIPDMLSGIVSRLISGQLNDTQTELSVDEFRQLNQLQDTFCKSCFIEPQVVDEITDPNTQITPAHIDDNDKATLFAFLGRPAAELASFRPAAVESMAGVLDSETGG